MSTVPQKCRPDAEAERPRPRDADFDRAPTRCSTACSVISDGGRHGEATPGRGSLIPRDNVVLWGKADFGQATTRRSTCSMVSGGSRHGEAEPAPGSPIPDDDVVLRGEEYCCDFQPKLVTLWPNRRRLPSVAFLKCYLEELKTRAIATTPPSMFERVKIRGYSELDLLEAEEDGANVEEKAASEQLKAKGLQAGSEPLRASPGIQKCNRRLTTAGQSSNMGQEGSEFARIRGLPTPRPSAKIGKQAAPVEHPGVSKFVCIRGLPTPRSLAKMAEERSTVGGGNFDSLQLGAMKRGPNHLASAGALSMRKAIGNKFSEQ